MKGLGAQAHGHGLAIAGFFHIEGEKEMEEIEKKEKDGGASGARGRSGRGSGRGRARGNPASGGDNASGGSAGGARRAPRRSPARSGGPRGPRGGVGDPGAWAVRPAPRAGAWQPVCLSAEIRSVLRRSMGPQRPIYSSGEVSVFVVLV